MDKQLSMIKKYFKNQDTIAYVHENEIILLKLESGEDGSAIVVDAQKTEKMLTRLEDSFSLDEFWITEWIFCQYSGESFVFVEEFPSGDGQMRCVENASELYDFILELIAEQERGIFVYRYCV